MKLLSYLSMFIKINFSYRSDRFTRLYNRLQIQKLKKEMEQISGVLKSGHQVASGMSPDNPYEKGTIEMQLPFFQALGLDLSAFFFGTLNIDIAPHTFKIVKPYYTFNNVKWHPNYPAEDFSFSPCEIFFQNFTYRGLVYYPYPETKIGHFQDPHVIEVIAPHIDRLKYGNTIKVAFNSDEIVIF